jgi:arylsulfatase A
MKRLVLLALSLLGSLAFSRPALEKPNVVIVMLDDSGYGDFSHAGNPTVNTANISRMVSEGANFPQFYSGSAACTASRYSILTGRNPVRSGFGAWVFGPVQAMHIHDKEITIAEGLKERGYATGIFGKWHLGTPVEANDFAPASFPLAQGFDQFVGVNVSHDHFSPELMLVRNDPKGTSPIKGYETIATDVGNKVPMLEALEKLYTDGAVKFIEENKDKPFFLHVVPNMPHLPAHAAKEFQGKSLRGGYGDCMENIDANVGRIIAAIKKAGIEKNTLVIFTSDNGPWIRFQNTPTHPKYGEARLMIGSALPFRDGKGSAWEGGHRVPGVFWWPGTIRPGTSVGAPVCSMDILPTAFALAGQTLPKDRTLDGRDIRPYLNSDVFSGTVPGFEFAYSGFNDNSIGAFRKGPWKLHTRIVSQTGNNYGFKASAETPLLFNVEEDPSERIDRATERPEVVQELKKAMDDYIAQVKKEGTFWDGDNPNPKAKRK